ncbi:hypothetical protein [Kitasatospora sp. NPDC056731]|uniref:hypothetical protein n=1 Tax=Kitasatospora sp. NPDC056731 TaxID=3155422 RepID=UPI00341DF03C
MKGQRIVLWSVLGGVLGVLGLGWALWMTVRPSAPEVPDPVGRWAGGTAAVELLPDGRVGSAQVPARVCSAASVGRERPTEIEGRWKKSVLDDVGPGVYVDATRKDGSGSCRFWLTAEENGKDLWVLVSQGFVMKKD